MTNIHIKLSLQALRKNAEPDFIDSLGLSLVHAGNESRLLAASGVLMENTLSGSLIDLLDGNLNGYFHIGSTGFDSGICLLNGSTKTRTVSLITLIICGAY